jgi:V/A-type H+-transporting ATPase subunit I
MISVMSFVQIVGPRELFTQVVDGIQETGILQIEEVPLAAGKGNSLLHRTQLTAEQVKLKEIYQDLAQILDEEILTHIPKAVAATLVREDAFDRQYRHWGPQDDSAVGAAARALHAEVRSVKRRERNLDDDLRVLSGYEEVVSALMPLLESERSATEHEFVGVVLERKTQQTLALLDQQMAKLTEGDYQILHATLGKGRVAVLIGFHQQSADQVRAFVRDAGLSQIRGPRYLRKKPMPEMLQTLIADLASLQQKQQELQSQKAAFFSEKGAQLMALRSVCHDRLDRLEALSKFAETRYTFIVEGWAPVNQLSELRAHLHQCDPTILLRSVKAHGAAGSPPVQLSNPRAIRPFQTLFGLLPLPQYGSIDPTWFMALFFPPIFGLMLGDIGYGLLLALGALLLWRAGRTRKLAKTLAIVVASCSFFTIVFGFVFGELFGTFGHHIGLKPIWRERIEVGAADTGKVLLSYLVFSVAVGAAHVLCGLVLGVINARRSKQTVKAVDCTARIVGIFGLFFVVGRLVNLLPPFFTSLGIVAWVIFFVLVAWTTVRQPTHGLMMPLELLGTVGNILSYARIMAVGLASAVLALLANQFGSMINNVVLAAIVVVLIHTLNLVLGIVDPTIQGLRLHYVEFFSKFYMAGGRVYSPFQKTGGKSL